VEWSRPRCCIIGQVSTNRYRGHLPVRDDGTAMLNERRTVKREMLPDGRWLVWTVVEELDGRGDVWNTRRELFTINYEPISNASGEILLKMR
jgi:hypothetical protein